MTNNNDRVLSRRGARLLTVEEAANVNAGSCPKVCTLTLCSITANGTATDGDIHEC